MSEHKSRAKEIAALKRQDLLNEVIIKLLKVTTGSGLTINEAVDVSIRLTLGIITDHTEGNLPRAIDVMEQHCKAVCDDLRQQQARAVHVVTDGESVN